MSKIVKVLCAILIFSTFLLAAVQSQQSDAVEQAFDRGKKMLPGLEKIRGLHFKRDVVMKVQSLEEFEAHLRKEIARQYGDDHGKSVMDALHRLGLVDHPMDLGDVVSDLMKSQAAAHYSPKDNAYFLLMPEMPPAMLDLISAHELFHALQDQHFDLHTFAMSDVKAIQDNGDAAAARQSLVEGEATLVMTLYGVQSLTGMSLEQAMPLVAQQMKMQAAMSYPDMIKSIKLQADMMKGLGMEQSADSIDKMPRYFVESIQAAYLKGGAMVQYIHGKQGWDGVDRLYKEPPSSTEQILHPEKLVGDRDEPIDVRLTELVKKAEKKDWRLLEEDVAGELGLFCYLDRWSADGGKTASSQAQGWGGDRYYFFRHAHDESAALVWRTEWDSPDDAEEFWKGYTAGLPERFEDAVNSDGPHHVWKIGKARVLQVLFDKQNKRVDIIDADSRQALDYFSNLLQ